MSGTRPDYDVLIIGGGITGSALLYVLSRYTTIPRIVLLEKYPKLAQVNSHKNSNSQTLHFGDIETNYSLAKATTVKAAAELVANYVEQKEKEKNKEGLFAKTHKMVLAVGEKEIKALEQRYEEIKHLFPELRKIGREGIAQLEPKIVEERDPAVPLLALCSPHGYAINFSALAESFVQEAQKRQGIEIMLGKKVKSIIKEGISKENHHHPQQDPQNTFYTIALEDRQITASVIVVAAGAHSLIFAQKLGYGKEYGILPIVGGFYCTRKVLNGKVYTMQTPSLPFAAVHGDPDVENPEETRFGPTGKALPYLEKSRWQTFPDFLKTSAWSLAGVQSLAKVTFTPVILRYILRNFSYDLPVLGKYFYLRDARKIIPSLKYRQLRFDPAIGGIRPQLVNIKEKKLEMGEAKILGDRIIFNITPSPGASVCLKNAEVDARKVLHFLNGKYVFNEKSFQKVFS
ncbi:MAG: FAD-dependent oxidoreductase [Nanoarchaeota archaeon]